MIRYVKISATALAVALALALGTVASAQGKDAPFATGEQWVNASRSGKLGYLLGIANVLEVEQALQVDNPPAENASMVPVMIRGLEGMTLTQVMEALDRWYAANPNELKQPVLHTIGLTTGLGVSVALVVAPVVCGLRRAS